MAVGYLDTPEYTKLLTELQEDPLGRNYAVMNDETRRSDLLETRYEVRTPVYITYRTIASVVEDYLRVEAIRAYIKANLPTFDEILSQYGDTNGQAGGLDNTKPFVRSFISGMVGEGDTQLRQEEATTLLNMGKRMVTRAYQIGLQDSWLTLGRLESARLRMGGV